MERPDSPKDPVAGTGAERDSEAFSRREEGYSRPLYINKGSGTIALGRILPQEETPRELQDVMKSLAEARINSLSLPGFFISEKVFVTAEGGAFLKEAGLRGFHPHRSFVSRSQKGAEAERGRLEVFFPLAQTEESFKESLRSADKNGQESGLYPSGYLKGLLGLVKIAPADIFLAFFEVEGGGAFVGADEIRIADLDEALLKESKIYFFPSQGSAVLQVSGIEARPSEILSLKPVKTAPLKHEIFNGGLALSPRGEILALTIYDNVAETLRLARIPPVEWQAFQKRKASAGAPEERGGFCNAQLFGLGEKQGGKSLL